MLHLLPFNIIICGLLLSSLNSRATEAVFVIPRLNGFRDLRHFCALLTDLNLQIRINSQFIDDWWSRVVLNIDARRHGNGIILAAWLLFSTTELVFFTSQLNRFATSLLQPKPLCSPDNVIGIVVDSSVTRQTSSCCPALHQTVVRLASRDMSRAFRRLPSDSVNNINASNRRRMRSNGR